MGEMPEQEKKDDAVQDAARQPSAAPAGQQSWGDKYQDKAYSFVRNVLTNYIVNFSLSTLITYAVVKHAPGNKEDTTWLNKKFNGGINWAVDTFGKGVEGGKKGMGLPNGLVRQVANFFTRVQLLMIGGHSLLPVMKYTHDHKKEFKFNYGHRLDVLQEKLGRGNAASKRNIAEYKYIQDLKTARQSDGKNGEDLPPLSEEDKALAAKYHLGDNLEFNEVSRGWGKVLKARLGGIVFATGLSVALGTLAHLAGVWKTSPKVNIGDVKVSIIDAENLMSEGGKLLGNNVLSKIPGIRNFKNVGQFGSIMILEMVSTLSSKIGFDRIEKKQLAKERQAEEQMAIASLPKDKAILEQLDEVPKRRFSEGLTPDSQKRRERVETGTTSFSARAQERSEEPAVGVA